MWLLRSLKSTPVVKVRRLRYQRAFSGAQQYRSHQPWNRQGSSSCQYSSAQSQYTSLGSGDNRTSDCHQSSCESCIKISNSKHRHLSPVLNHNGDLISGLTPTSSKIEIKTEANTFSKAFQEMQLELLPLKSFSLVQYFLCPDKGRHFCNASDVRHFHTTRPNECDIPDYLLGNISKVSSVEDDLLETLQADEENDMENEILDFLAARLISYEESDSSLIVPCPHCAKDDHVVGAREIFVDKNSGYFVCPWCSRAGSWEDLRVLLNASEDTLTPQELHSHLEATLPISRSHVLMLEESPFKNVKLNTLKKFGTRLTSDCTRVVVPVTDASGEPVGFESVSLLHPIPQVVRRYVVGKSRVLGLPGNVKNHNNHQRVLVVPNSCDVLSLAEHNIPAISLPSAGVEALSEYLRSRGQGELALWLGVEPPPRSLLLFLIQSGVACSIIRSEAKASSLIHTKTLAEITAALKDSLPILSDDITMFSLLRDKIYHRLTHKEEVCGVQWKRYFELNNLLMGHRPGEMTILTGPTGSGKTTFMAEYSLDLCSEGVRTLWGSFEVSVVRLCEVMLQQFTGSPIPPDLASFNVLAAKFSTLPLHFLTFHGQQTASSVIKAMIEAVRVWGVQHVIIDNLQFMLGTTDHSIDRWWEQDRAVSAFRRFATEHNCHVTLVVHPKKVPQGQMLNIESVFGGGKVTQEADNVLILQVKDGSSITQPKKALQVVKNRYGGYLGVMPLKFHKESLTFSSCFQRKDKEKEKSNQGAAQNKRVVSHKKNIKGIDAFMN